MKNLIQKKLIFIQIKNLNKICELDISKTLILKIASIHNFKKINLANKFLKKQI